MRSWVLTSGYPFQTDARRWDFYTPPGTDPRTFRWSGGDTYRKNDLTNLVFDLQQNLTDDLWLRITGGYTHNKEDSRNIWYGRSSSLDPFDANGNVVNAATATLPSYYRTPGSAAERQSMSDLAAAAALGGTAFVDVFKARPSNFWLGDISGPTVTPTSRLGSTAPAAPARNTVLNYQWSQYNLDEDRWQGRIDLNYRFDYLGHHNFLVGVQYRLRSPGTHELWPGSRPGPQLRPQEFRSGVLELRESRAGPTDPVGGARRWRHAVGAIAPGDVEPR